MQLYLSVHSIKMGINLYILNTCFSWVSVQIYVLLPATQKKLSDNFKTLLESVVCSWNH